MRALVTGGAGFIGSHLVDHLLNEQGSQVLVVDDLSSGRLNNLPSTIQTVRAGLNDPELPEIFATFRPEVVYHLAAQASVVVSVRDPILDARVNVLGMIAVCEAAVACQARKIVFASSGGTVYGDPPPSALPVPETYVGTPTSPYGITKRVMHDYLAFYKDVHGLDFTALALSNVYGPRQDPHGEAGVIAIWSQHMLAGEECLLFGDGEQTRDFVYVADVADAFVRAAHAGAGEVVNIGTGIETSVNQTYDTLAAALSFEKPVTRKPARPGELRRIALDVRKAERVLEWTPKVAFDSGIASTSAWFASRERATRG